MIRNLKEAETQKIETTALQEIQLGDKDFKRRRDTKAFDSLSQCNAFYRCPLSSKHLASSPSSGQTGGRVAPVEWAHSLASLIEPACCAPAM